MVNGSKISFSDDLARGEYARRLRELFDKASLYSWWVYPSAKTEEICIEPKNGTYKEFLWENVKPITRISIEAKDNKFSFGVSGYDSPKINGTQETFENRKYNYHDKGYTSEGRPKGRWWFTQSFDNLEKIADEFREIEHFLKNNAKSY